MCELSRCSPRHPVTDVFIIIQFTLVPFNGGCGGQHSPWCNECQRDADELNGCAGCAVSLPPCRMLPCRTPPRPCTGCIAPARPPGPTWIWEIGNSQISNWWENYFIHYITSLDRHSVPWWHPGAFHAPSLWQFSFSVVLHLSRPFQW